MSKIQKALQALKLPKSDHDAHGVGQGKSLNQRYTNNIEDRTAVPEQAGRSEISSHIELTDFGNKIDVVEINHKIELELDHLENVGLSPGKEHFDVLAQQFRRIKRPILRTAFDVGHPTVPHANVIMMASALPGAGKSFCAFNLAQSIAVERDVGAILVDADVLKPGLSRLLGLENNVGLIDYLLDSEISISDIMVQTNVNNMIVIPAGNRHHEATELLSSRRMRELVSLLSMQFTDRAVIFDTPPLLVTNEAQVLASQAGQIVMVIEAGISSQESAMRAVGLLDRQKPINAILNKSKNAVGGTYGQDDYGNYTYSSAERDNANIT